MSRDRGFVCSDGFWCTSEECQHYKEGAHSANSDVMNCRKRDQELTEFDYTGAVCLSFKRKKEAGDGKKNN